MKRIEVGQVRTSSDGAEECDVNEALKSGADYVCRTRRKGKHGAPLEMLWTGDLLTRFPVVVPHA